MNLSPANLQRQYLQTALAWLDIRLEQEVRRWQSAGENPSDRFRGLYITDEQARSLAARRGPQDTDLSAAEEAEFDRLREQVSAELRAVHAGNGF